MTALIVAGGRTLPRLLFATNATRLGFAIGGASAYALLGRINDVAGYVIDDLPYGEDAPLAVTEVLNRRPEIEGVVILGGHEVVPQLATDVLDGTGFEHYGDTETDGFWVWSDDWYGFREWPPQQPGKKIFLPDVPVSRIPDGRSAELMQQALAADRPAQKRAALCLRNMNRRYARWIFRRHVSLFAPVIESAPYCYDRVPPESLAADLVYLALHGSVSDPGFYGEEAGGGAIPAIRAENIDSVAARVVLAACCWSALIVDTPACAAASGHPVHSRSEEDSLALALLRRGTTAFIGCTAVHHAGDRSIYGGAAPLHGFIWSRLKEGTPPARALLEAKRDYVKEMFRSDRDVLRAIEIKSALEFTCLGLGY